MTLASCQATVARATGPGVRVGKYRGNGAAPHSEGLPLSRRNGAAPLPETGVFVITFISVLQ